MEPVFISYFMWSSFTKTPTFLLINQISVETNGINDFLRSYYFFRKTIFPKPEKFSEILY